MMLAGLAVTGVVIAGTGWAWLDPAVSLVITVLVLVGTWSLLQDAVHPSMDAVPPGIERQVRQVRRLSFGVSTG